MQSEHVSDPAELGLRSAERGGSTLFQKGGPNMIRQNGQPPPASAVHARTTISDASVTGTPTLA